VAYKNGKPIIWGGENRRIAANIEYHTWINNMWSSEMRSYFYRDSTVVSSYRHRDEFYDSNYVLNRAFNIGDCNDCGSRKAPLSIEKKWRRRVSDKFGLNVQVEWLKFNFSSPLFYCDSLNMREIEKNSIATHRPEFPTQDCLWQLRFNQIADISYPRTATLHQTDAILYFYIDIIREELVPVFESRKDGEMVARYCVGGLNEANESGADKSAEIPPCPVILKTSDGDVMFLPNGTFMLKK
jgi:hypothetical protein